MGRVKRLASTIVSRKSFQTSLSRSTLSAQDSPTSDHAGASQSLTDSSLHFPSMSDPTDADEQHRSNTPGVESSDADDQQEATAHCVRGRRDSDGLVSLSSVEVLATSTGAPNDRGIDEIRQSIGLAPPPLRHVYNEEEATIPRDHRRASEGLFSVSGSPRGPPPAPEIEKQGDDGDHDEDVDNLPPTSKEQDDHCGVNNIPAPPSTEIKDLVNNNDDVGVKRGKAGYNF